MEKKNPPKLELSQIMNEKLIPNIVMQYNLRQQIQSQNILLDFKSQSNNSMNAQNDSEEIDQEVVRLHGELEQSQLQQ